jgi:CRP-like cAMP-binding protein
MPEPMRDPRLLRELLFVAFSAGRRIESWVAERLRAVLGERRISAGTTLYTEGELPDHVYFMNGGAIEFSRAGSPTFTREGRWVIGINEAVAMTERRRTAVARTDLTLLTTPAITWKNIVEDDIDVARGFVFEGSRAIAAMHEMLAPDGGFDAPGATCTLPDDGPLNLVDRLLFLRGVPLLAAAGVQALADLARACDEVRFEAGEIILPRGVARDHLQLVVSGMVEVERSDPTLRARFGPGDCVGGLIAIGDARLEWEARALEPTRALSLPVELWADEMDDHFELFRSAIDAIIDRREELTDRLVERTGMTVMR